MSDLSVQIWDAANDGDTMRVEDLLRKARPNDLLYQRKFGSWTQQFTALMVAAFHGHLDIARMLIESGADVNYQEPQNGWTALMWACDTNKIAIAQLLVRAGANLDLQQEEGQTALMMAARFNRDTVHALLAWKANVNVQDKNGWTALMWSAHNGLPKISRLLVKAGADRSIRNKDRKTAADLAKTRRSKQVIYSYRRVRQVRRHIFEWIFGPSTEASTAAPVSAAASFADNASAGAGSGYKAGVSNDVSSAVASAPSLEVAECAALEGECDAFSRQFAQAPHRKQIIEQREALQAQFSAAQSARPVNYGLVRSLGEALEALKLEAAQLPLTEEDYLTLAARHAALVQRVEAKCQQLMLVQEYTAVSRLAGRLAALQALNLSPFQPVTAVRAEVVTTEAASFADLFGNVDEGVQYTNVVVPATPYPTTTATWGSPGDSFSDSADVRGGGRDRDRGRSGRRRGRRGEGSTEGTCSVQ